MASVTASRLNAAETMTSVFDDTQFSVVIAPDANNNGLIDPEELRDVRKNYLGRKKSATYYPTDVGDSYKPTFQMDDVRFEALGITARVPTWRCEPKQYAAGDNTWATPSIQFHENSASDSFSLVLRLKWDGSSVTVRDWNGQEVSFDNEETQVFVRNGFDNGWWLGVAGDGRPTFNPRYADRYSTSSIVFTPGVWYDFAVTGVENGDNDTLTFYALDPDTGKLITRAWTGPILDGAAGRVFFGPRRPGSGFGPDAENGRLRNGSNYLDGFIGNIQFMGYWPRALDVDEIHEAWTMSAAGRWSIGLRNNSDASQDLQEFAGAQDTVFKANAGSWWGDFPAAIEPGHFETVSFPLVPGEATLPFVLELCGVNDGEATVNVSANGSSIGSVTVSDSAAGLLYIPANTFTNGTNTVTLAVTGSNSWEPDYLGLFGSFQMGVKDTDWAEFYDGADSDMLRFWTENRSLAGVQRVLFSGQSWKMSARMPREVAENYPFKFTFTSHLFTDPGLESFISVNGNSVWSGYIQRESDHEIDIPAGIFRGGINYLRLEEEQHSYGGNSYIAADCFRMEVCPPPAPYPKEAVFQFK